MNINHKPHFDTAYIEEHYSKKDGVTIKYVCTTTLDNGTGASDIFYRDTPHPDFGNKYFGIIKYNEKLYIHNADKVEGLTFVMLDTPEGMCYSSHRHDYVVAGGWAIDGGRAYTRLIGSSPKTVTLKVKDGGFVNVYS